MKFNDFVSEQVDRLGAIAEFAMKISVAGQKEIVTWLITEAAEPTPIRKRTGSAEWLRESESARKVKALIDEAVEFTAPPGLSDIKAAWRRMHPPANETRKNCGRCDGSGWIVVDGPYGTSAAYPCTHREQTASEDRMGVRIPAAVEAQYKRDSIEAQGREIEFRNSAHYPPTKFGGERRSKPADPLRRVSAVDFNGLMP